MSIYNLFMRFYFFVEKVRGVCTYSVYKLYKLFTHMYTSVENALCVYMPLDITINA